MMFARALSQGVRWYCPDVTAGTPAYSPEELGGEVDPDAGPLAVEATQHDAAPPPEAEPADPEPPADPLDAERVDALGKAIGAIGLTYREINAALVELNAPELDELTGPGLRARLESLTTEQADALEAKLAAEADRRAAAEAAAEEAAT